MTTELTSYDIIEKTRQEFFTSAATAAALIRMSLLNVDELDDLIDAAAECRVDLGRAYARDLGRMDGILQCLRNEEVPDL